MVIDEVSKDVADAAGDLGRVVDFAMNDIQRRFAALRAALADEATDDDDGDNTDD